MKLKTRVKSLLKKALIFGFSFLFLFFQIGAVAAEESAPAPAPVGVQGAVGAQGPVGVQGEVGAQGPVGVQGDIGAHPVVTATPSANVSSPPEPVTPAPADNAPAVTSATEQTTGPAAANGETSANTSNTNIDINNDATTNNNTNLNLNTGSNTIGQNTVTGNTTSGDIGGAVNLLNVSNSVFAPGSSVGSQLINGATTNQLTLIPATNRFLLENATTGPDSVNLNTVSNPNVVEIFANNNATDNNAIEIAANTGRNDILSNTKTGNLTTGDVNLGVNLINIANLLMPNTLLSADIWNVLGPFNGNIVIPELSNLVTGPNSTNQNIIDASNRLSVNLDQNADLSNVFDFATNTGRNTVGNNTVTGDVSTGESTVRTALTNIANIVAEPVLYLINVFGKWTGSLAGLDPSRVVINEINDTTGPNSENKNEVNVGSNTNIDIHNNATVNNRININANTGDNRIENNTLVGDIRTGSVNVAANVVNIVNSFSEEVGRFALRIINIFGNFNGNVTPPPAKAHASYRLKKKAKVKTTIVSNVEEVTESFMPAVSEESEIGFTPALARISTGETPETTQIAGVTSGSLQPSGGIDPTSSFPWKIVLAVFVAAFGLGWLILELFVVRFNRKMAINKE